MPAPVHEYPFAAGPAQETLVESSPSALQTRRVFTSRHEYVPGVQAQGAHKPALQVVLAPQGTLE